MKFNESNNPMFGEKTYAKVETLERRRNGGGPFIEETSTMTVTGAVNKTFALVGLMMLTFGFGFIMPNMLYAVVGSIAAFIIYMVTAFKPHLAPTLAPAYALVQGLVVGTFSALFSYMYDGIIFQAFSLTIAILLSMLMIYKSGLIKVTSKFRMGVTMAVGSVMIMYVISAIGYFVGFEVPFLHEGGMIGIGLSLLIIGIASLNLLLDFDNFDKGEEMQMPKYMEWYFGMGLLFTLIWLYLELMTLIANLRE